MLHKHRLRAFGALTVCAALAAGPTLGHAQQTYTTGSLKFERGGHNQWGAPGEQGVVTWEKTTGEQSIDLDLGLIELGTGAAIRFTLSGEIGIAARVTGRGGELAVTYPARVNITYPDPRTIRPGESFKVGSSFSRTQGSKMSSTAPEWAFRLSAILKADLKCKALVQLAYVDIVNEELFELGPYDLSTTIFDTDLPGFKEAVNKYSGDFTLFNGLVKGWWGFPTVKTSGGEGPDDTLISSGSGAFVRLNFSITNVLLMLAGLPPLNRSGSLAGGDIKYAVHILDLFLQSEFGLGQHFKFSPKPLVSLQLSNGETVTFNAGEEATIVMPTASTGSAANNLTITPTVIMEGDVRNNSTLRVGAGLYFDPLSASIEIDYHGLEWEGHIGGAFEIIGGDIEVDIMNQTFLMKGFNPISTSPFTVEGFLYEAPTLSSVTPMLIKKGQGTVNLTLNGTNFVDAYTNASGTIAGSKAHWDGSARPTTYGGPQLLTASISAEDTNVEGIHTVTVLNPSPGGGVSNGVTVVVDGSAPDIMAAADPAALDRTSNPNLLVSVTVSGSIVDPLSGVDATTAKFSVSDEYGLVQPSGPITLNPDGTFAFVVRLNPTRSARDSDGRLYGIKLEAKDRLGFTAVKTIDVVVR